MDNEDIPRDIVTIYIEVKPRKRSVIEMVKHTAIRDALHAKRRKRGRAATLHKRSTVWQRVVTLLSSHASSEPVSWRAKAVSSPPLPRDILPAKWDNGYIMISGDIIYIANSTHCFVYTLLPRDSKPQQKAHQGSPLRRRSRLRLRIARTPAAWSRT